MTGVLNALVAGALGAYSVTLGRDGSVTGYSSLGIGSIAPNNSFAGNTLIRIYGEDAADAFVIRVGSATTQSMFTAVEIQKSDGSWTRLTSSSATFSGSDQWRWVISGGPTNSIWPVSADGTVKRVVFR